MLITADEALVQKRAWIKISRDPPVIWWNPFPTHMLGVNLELQPSGPTWAQPFVIVPLPPGSGAGQQPRSWSYCCRAWPPRSLKGVPTQGSWASRHSLYLKWIQPSDWNHHEAVTRNEQQVNKEREVAHTVQPREGGKKCLKPSWIGGPGQPALIKEMSGPYWRLLPKSTPQSSSSLPATGQPDKKAARDPRPVVRLSLMPWLKESSFPTLPPHPVASKRLWVSPGLPILSITLA